MAMRPGTEQKLLDAAEELFFTRGIAATPIDAVLERAGISSATLYRGYASKEALVAAALGRRHDDWLATWDAAVAAAHDDRGRLLAVFDALDAYRSTRPGRGGARSSGRRPSTSTPRRACARCSTWRPGPCVADWQNSRYPWSAPGPRRSPTTAARRVRVPRDASA
ncbi:helix-turn-helix domain containing protein [Curtobacterium flaccumfaciens]|nr:helix-turn-helix domain containing protein [Curtobacterium flaccumfaciens]